MQPTLNIAFRAARKAGEYINRFFDRQDQIEISEKSPGDYVTSVDTNCEAIIIDSLKQSFPDSGFIGEESGNNDIDKNMVWIIDPLDGTNNFIHRFPYFCVSIGCQINGRLEHGLIFNPLTQDVYFASKGHGAQKNNQKIRATQPNKKLKGSLILHQANFANIQNPNYIKTLIELKKQVSGIRYTGSTALDLAHLASGQADLFFTYNPKPWDYAAGVVIAKEAGAIVCDLKGGTDFGQENGILVGSANIISAATKILANT
jgi:myo-inositol-1(or 4)-monophosphatase